MSEEEVVGTAIIRLEVDRSAADEEMARAAEEYGRTGSARAKQQGEKDGREQGDAFSRALKAKLEIAFRSLPNAPQVMIGANITEAGQKILAIKDELLALKNHEIGVTITDAEAVAKIAELRTQLAALAKDKDIRVRVDANAAAAALGALAKQFGDVDEKAKAASASALGMGEIILRTAVLAGPAIFGLAGGLLAASTALIGFGVVGAIAFGSIKNAITNSTAAGLQFQAMYAGFKPVLTGIRDLVTAGLTPGLQTGITNLRAQLPVLSVELGQSATKLGQFLSNIVGGLIAGFEKFNPVIQAAETGAVNLAAKFNAWESGPGGTKFINTLLTDLHQIGPLFSSLGTLLSHLFQGLAVGGVGTLSTLTTLIQLLNKLPVGVIQAAAIAFVAFKTAVIAGDVFTFAANGLAKFTGATNAAALATERMAGTAAVAGSAGAVGGIKGLAGSFGLLLSRAVPYVATLTAIELGTNILTKKTDEWATSQNKLSQYAGDTLHTFKDIITLNFGDIGRFIDRTSALTTNIKSAQTAINSLQLPNIEKAYGINTSPSTAPSPPYRGRGATAISPSAPAIDAEAQYRQNVLLAGQYKSLFQSYQAEAVAAQEAAAKANYANSGLNAEAAKYAQLAYDANEKLIAQQQKLSSGDPLANSLKEYAHYQTIQNDAANQYIGTVLKTNAANLTYVQSTNDASGAISQSAAAYSTLEGTVQKNIDAETTYLATKKNETTTIDGVKYSYAAWADAMDKATAAGKKGNDATAYATGSLKGHTIALQDDKSFMAELLTEQGRITTAYANAGVDLKLTTAQLDLYSSALGITSTQLGTGAITAATFEQVMSEVKTTLMNANTANAAWLASIDTFNKSGQTAADVAALLGAALKAGRGVALDNAGVNLSAASAAEAAGAAIAQYSNSIDRNGNLLGQLTKTTHGYIVTQPDLTAGSLAIANALTQQATAAQTASEQVYQNEVNIKGSGVAAQDALDTYKGYRQSLIDTAISSGASAKQAQVLADKYLGIPKNIDTFIKQIGAGDVNSAIAGLTTAINNLNKNIKIQIGADYTGFENAYSTIVNQINNLPTNLRINAGASTLSSISGIPQAQGSVLTFYAQGGIQAAEHFANGGESHIAQIAPAGSLRVWNEPETGGEAYIPLSPAKRGRSTQILAEVASQFGVGHAAGSVSHGGAATATDSRIDDLISTLEAFVHRPVVLEANRIQLAKVVNDQNHRNDRRN